MIKFLIILLAILFIITIQVGLVAILTALLCWFLGVAFNLKLFFLILIVVAIMNLLFN